AQQVIDAINRVNGSDPLFLAAPGEANATGRLIATTYTNVTSGGSDEIPSAASINPPGPGNALTFAAEANDGSGTLAAGTFNNVTFGGTAGTPARGEI